MRIDTTNLTPEAHRAIIECLKIAAQRGRQLREAQALEQNTTLAGRPNINPADGAYSALTEEKESQERKAAQQEELNVQQPTRNELEAIEANIPQTERKASGLARTLASLQDTDPDGVVTKSMQADVDQTNALYREQVKRRAELQAKLSARRLGDEAIAEIMQYARDVHLGIQNADDDTKRRMLDALGVQVKVKDGHYKDRCVLGETEGTVRKIPRIDSRSVVTASRSCNGPNDTALRIPGPRRQAPAASSVPNSGHSALRS